MSVENKQVLARNLLYLMDVNNKSRKDVAEALKTNYSRVSDWLNCRTYPRPDAIDALASFFRVSRADLVDPPHSNNISVGRDSAAPIISGSSNITINNQLPPNALGEVCQMYQSLPPEAKQQIDSLVKMLYSMNGSKDK